MLKGIDNRLNADVLHALRAMGHGDVLVIADTNFPADRLARATVVGKLLRMENLTAPEAVEAVLSVLPLDTFVEDFATRMQIVDAPGEVPPVQAEVQAAIDAAEGRSRPMIGVERFDFYERAREAYAVIQTGERRAAILRLFPSAQRGDCARGLRAAPRGGVGASGGDI